MPRHRIRPDRQLTRVLVLWLLALVLPLQSAAVGVFGALGPAHVHRAVERPLVLEDFRRWKAPVVAPAHILVAFGHFHAGAAPLRHHHASDDASVVHVQGDPADSDEAADTGALSALALIPAAAPWAQPERVASAAPRPPLARSTRFIAPPDRPPSQV